MKIKEFKANYTVGPITQKAYKLNGETDYVLMSPMYFGGNISISIWIKWEDLSSRSFAFSAHDGFWNGYMGITHLSAENSIMFIYCIS